MTKCLMNAACIFCTEFNECFLDAVVLMFILRLLVLIIMMYVNSIQ